ncbi:MAG: hypothetical protein IJ514_02705 [Clostridia bacterium]|nr:hypothetical protein [Clostridia bacterium]
MKFYPIHMHMHCSHEQSASIGSHMSYAAGLGIRHLWTTEHDTRMGKKKKAVPVFYFPKKELFVTLENGAQIGFKEDEGNSGRYTFEETEEGISLRLSAASDQRESLFFYSQGKLHSDPLFSRLTVEMNADMVAPFDENGRVIVEFILSAQPPTYTQAKLCYVTGPLPRGGVNVQYLPFPEKTNGVYRFPLYQDASEKIGGLDNALCNIRLVVEKGAKMVFRTFAFHRELEFEAVRQEQIKLAEKLGKKWGVTPFVGFEISGAGNHKNCYSTKVPVIDYAAFDYKVSNEQAVAHVKKHGGIFSWNHPLWKSAAQFPEKTDEEIVADFAETLIKERVYGATLIEVGFPYGRDGFGSAEAYLRLWDKLSENGVFITGDGDSDNHDAVADGWTEGNNFCTFAGLLKNEAPTEESFVNAFRRGSVWAGNPVKIRELSFGTGDKPMGSVLVGEKADIRFSSSGIKSDGYAVCVINGERSQRIDVKDGKFSGECTLYCDKKYNFARLEVYDADGILIAFSNPIYLVANEKDIPPEAVDNKRS